MRGILTILLICGVVTACGPQERDAPPARVMEKPAAPIEIDPTVPVAQLQDIGDVEQRVRISGTLAEHAAAPNIDVVDRITPHDVYTMSTITVSPPYPEELWIGFTVSTPDEWGDNPVVLHTTILRDDEPLVEFPTVLGEHAHRTEHPERGEWLDRYQEVDVLQGLDTVPDTMLVIADARALLMPVGTEEEDLDPYTAETPETRRTVLSSNPVRINFEPQ